MSPGRRLALGTVLAAIAALAWLGYQRPDFTLWFANSLFLCS